MKVYRDRWFCQFKNCAKFNGCDRAMTQAVIESAKLAHLWIEQIVDKPECFEER